MTAPPISRYPVPKLEDLPEDIRARMLEVQEKAGFIPNVFLALAHRPDEFRAFFAYHDALMLRDSGLTKAEREMIVVAVAGANDCLYCFVAHGAILRVYAKAPLVADQVGVNYRKADITPRQKAMLAFALKVSDRSAEIDDDDYAALEAHGFTDRGHLGHRQHLGVLLPVEPDGESHRPASERRVLHARQDAQTPNVGSGRRTPAAGDLRCGNPRRRIPAVARRRSRCPAFPCRSRCRAAPAPRRGRRRR